jgi:hypothetical protein
MLPSSGSTLHIRQTPISNSTIMFEILYRTEFSDWPRIIIGNIENQTWIQSKYKDLKDQFLLGLMCIGNILDTDKN